ncbi:hypothetical protein EXU57_14980 [Segetibacter sp. 3557_3]|uniref:hypothetical protein n=1 Tax=Segetibacter sp. 3557_3 TaxID=2547429 RepID=UPI00105879DA|nr:hypothetical protein [Segetibacter sp. 3557_3]TDH24637.1 hypothetical protein EXU57_14980 [Segetibacter sp. 3557_3]
MRILFICGSLEPGRDGVGDYTQRLAAQLTLAGHQIGLIALSDNYQLLPLRFKNSDKQIIRSMLRLPRSLSRKARLALAKEFIDDFNPNYLSLQFVPFSFDSKGLPFALPHFLKLVGGKRKWHIMFHELWLGMEIGASLKYKVWGYVQKLIIKDLVIKLKPVIIHTQTLIYIEQLLNIGIASHHLPLFGNIPNVNAEPNDSMTERIRKASYRKEVSFIIFGGIHIGGPVQEFATEVALYQANSGIRVSLTLIGRCGAGQLAWKNAWEKEGLRVIILGEQLPGRISTELNAATIGIVTTPYLLVGKSGSAAGMIEHGLPVLCVSKKWEVRGTNNLELPPEVEEYKKGNLEQFISTKTRSGDRIKISQVAELLLNNLLTS